MKTTVKSILVMAFMAFFLLPKSGQSQQCNYAINNGTQCTYTATVAYIDGLSCSNVCSTSTVICPPGATPVSCSGCGTLCNIIVTIIGYTPVDSGNPTTTGAAPCVNSGCASPPNTIDIRWSAFGTDIGCNP